jgi:hypothetical protein
MALDFLSLASSLCRCRASLAARAPPSLALLLSYSSWLVLLLAKNPMYVAYVSCHFLIYTISMDGRMCVCVCVPENLVLDKPERSASGAFLRFVALRLCAGVFPGIFPWPNPSARFMINDPDR